MGIGDWAARKKAEDEFIRLGRKGITPFLMYPVVAKLGNLAYDKDTPDVIGESKVKDRDAAFGPLKASFTRDAGPYTSLYDYQNLQVGVGWWTHALPFMMAPFTTGLM